MAEAMDELERRIEEILRSGIVPDEAGDQLRFELQLYTARHLRRLNGSVVDNVRRISALEANVPKDMKQKIQKLEDNVPEGLEGRLTSLEGKVNLLLWVSGAIAVITIGWIVNSILGVIG